MARRPKLSLTDEEARLLMRAIRTDREFLKPEELAPFLSLTSKLKQAFGVEVLFPSITEDQRRIARARQVPPSPCPACRGDGRRWDARKGGYHAEPCPSCGATGEGLPRRAPGATLPQDGPSLRVEMGKSQYGTPEPRLILSWPRRGVPHGEAMMFLHGVAAVVWQARPSDALWLVNVPFGPGEDRQGRTQATISIETVSGTTEEADAAMKVLGVVVAQVNNAS